MSYAPNIALTLNGVDLKPLVIDEVVITSGRQTVQEQPYTSSCTLALAMSESDTTSPEINDVIRVSVDSIEQYAGYITDITTTLTGSVPGDRIVNMQISCLGFLSILSRTPVGSAGFPSQKDGDRVNEIIVDAHGYPWTVM